MPTTSVAGVGQTIGVCGLPADSTVFYRRRLPHWIPDDAVFFLTWRLAGSVPVPLPDIITLEYLAGGKKRSPAAPSGPFWLQDARIAGMVANALRYGESSRRLYQLYAWVIMPNHVHVILKPHVELSAATQWLKGRTARVGNRMLNRTGMPFWQDESFDHWVRSTQELQGLIEYVEDNPVKADLVQGAAQWPWSSAAQQAAKWGRRSPCVVCLP